MLLLAITVALAAAPAAPKSKARVGSKPAAAPAAAAPNTPAPAAPAAPAVLPPPEATSPVAPPRSEPAPPVEASTPPAAVSAPVTLPPPVETEGARPAAAAARPEPPAASAPARVGVVDFSSTPELQPLAAALGGFVANELQRLGAFQVTTTDQIRQMLSLERQAQLLGCPDDSCRGQLVVSLGFDYVVTGKVTKLGGAKGSTLALELVLLDQKTGQRLASDVAQGATEAELLSRIAPSTIKLVNAPLKERSGKLVLACSESGATVKLDDVIVGTTPIGQTTAAGGPHLVSVEKAGFVSWQKEVRVRPDELVHEDVRLVPSRDFIEAYQSKQRALRAAMYGALALAVAGIVTDIASGFVAQQRYGSETTPGTFLYARRHILDGIESEQLPDGSTVDHRQDVNRFKAEVETYRAAGYIGIGLGVAFGITAAALRIFSEDPNRYDLYRSADVRVKAGALLGPGHAGAALSGSF